MANPPNSCPHYLEPVEANSAGAVQRCRACGSELSAPTGQATPGSTAAPYGAPRGRVISAPGKKHPDR